MIISAHVTRYLSSSAGLMAQLYHNLLALDITELEAVLSKIPYRSRLQVADSDRLVVSNISFPQWVIVLCITVQ